MEVRSQSSNSENHLNCWDAGYSQLKTIWKDYFPSEFKDFMKSNGVLLLNMSLTVRAGSPNSHKVLWNRLINLIISTINRNNPNIKFILLGKEAQSIIPLLIEPNYIKGPHPASYIYKPEVGDSKYRELKLVFKELKFI
jgi:uracil DNA glycosylase